MEIKPNKEMEKKADPEPVELRRISKDIWLDGWDLDTTSPSAPEARCTNQRSAEETDLQPYGQESQEATGRNRGSADQ